MKRSQNDPYWEVVVEQYDNGMTPEDLVRAYDTLELADVHAVIAYYLRHKDEVTAYLKRRKEEADALRDLKRLTAVEIEVRVRRHDHILEALPLHSIDFRIHVFAADFRGVFVAGEERESLAQCHVLLIEILHAADRRPEVETGASVQP